MCTTFSGTHVRTVRTGIARPWKLEVVVSEVELDVMNQEKNVINSSFRKEVTTIDTKKLKSSAGSDSCRTRHYHM